MIEIKIVSESVKEMKSELIELLGGAPVKQIEQPVAKSTPAEALEVVKKVVEEQVQEAEQETPAPEKPKRASRSRKAAEEAKVEEPVATEETPATEEQAEETPAEEVAETKVEETPEQEAKKEEAPAAKTEGAVTMDQLRQLLNQTTAGANADTKSAVKAEFVKYKKQNIQQLSEDEVQSFYAYLQSVKK